MATGKRTDVVGTAARPPRLARPPRRIAVTGAGGFIGSHVAEALLAAGHEVRGIEGFIDSYARSAKARNLRGLVGHPRFRLIEADLSRDPLDAHLEGIDVVVNEAALAGLPRSWTDIDAYSRHNIVALQRLLDASRRMGVRRFVHASTSSVYGRMATGGETSPTRPVSPYGATKLAGEHLVTAYADNFHLPVVILRYFSIYGPRQRPDMAYSIFIDRILAGQPLTVYGDGSQSRSNTYIADCVNATLLAIERARPGEVYNIGGGSVVSLREAIDLLAEILRIPARITTAPPRSGDQRHTRADIAKATAELGYVPLTLPAAGLAAQVRWHLAERAGAQVAAAQRSVSA